jgi:long-chain fatty acid transport protein
LVVLSLFAMAHSTAHAGGFYLPEIATPGSVGSAGATNPTNTIDSSSAITNPAAMVHLEKDRAYLVGGQIMAPEMSFDSDIATGGGSDGGNAGDVALAPGFSYARRIDDKSSIGFGLSALMGGGVDYGDDFVGRYQATSAILTGAGLTASYGYKVNDEVSIGAGVTAVYTVFEQDIAINRPATLPDGEVSLEEIDGWDPQFTLGLTWRLNKKALLGFVYRSKAEIELEGKLKTKNLSAPPFTLLDGQDVTLEFDAPEVFEIGLQYDIDANTKLFLEADIERFSQFDQNYLTVDSTFLVSATTVRRSTTRTGLSICRSTSSYGSGLRGAAKSTMKATGASRPSTSGSATTRSTRPRRVSAPRAISTPTC